MKRIIISLPEAINLLPDAVLVINHKGKIVMVNEVALVLFGYQEKELLSKKIDALMPKRIRQKRVLAIEAYLKNPVNRKMGEDMHLVACRKNGEELDVDVALAPVNIKGEKLIIASVRDVTELKSLERSLLGRNEQLSVINTELERFGYIIAHDLKSPLLNLHAIVSLLKRELPEEKSHNLEMYMDALDLTLRSMMNLISGVADYSKVGFAGRIDTDVNLDEVLEEVRSLVHLPAHIKLEIPEKLPVLYGNRTKLLQVFLNLINNAIKYNDKPEGKIVIRCRKLKNEYRLSVSDNGPGVPVGLRKQIFGLFRKGNIHKEGSEGIGLAVVKKIITDHGGTIKVTTSKMGGAEFQFNWPVKPNQASIEPELLQVTKVKTNGAKPLKKAA